MNTMGAPVDPRELEAAFSLFNEASRQLAESYADLQKQVVFLTTQLEIANGALRNEFNEKSALSRRLTLLLDRLPAGVVELHADGSVAQLNTAALGMLGDVQDYGLPHDYVLQQRQLIENMTVEDIRRLASDWLHPEAMHYVIVGDAATQLPGLLREDMNIRVVSLTNP